MGCHADGCGLERHKTILLLGRHKGEMERHLVTVEETLEEKAMVDVDVVRLGRVREKRALRGDLTEYTHAVCANGTTNRWCKASSKSGEDKCATMVVI